MNTLVGRVENKPNWIPKIHRTAVQQIAVYNAIQLLKQVKSEGSRRLRVPDFKTIGT